MGRGQTFDDTTPLPSCEEFLEKMKKTEDERKKKRDFKEICFPLENNSVKPVNVFDDLEEGVYKVIEIVEYSRNNILKLEDKKGGFHYIEERFSSLSELKSQALICHQKGKENVIVKYSGGYYQQKL